jgi:hypothetical protein
MIRTEKIKDLKSYSIKIHKKPEPRCNNEALPSFFFNALFIGITGAGKSYSMIKLLKMYEHEGVIDDEGFACEMRYILISPTSKSDANAVFQLLKIEEDDLIDDFSFDVLEDKVNELIEEKKMISEWNLYCKVFKKFYKNQDIDSLTDEELEVLEKYGMDPDETPRRKKTKIYWLIVDDMIGSGIFSRSNKNKFNNLVILCRHHSICIAMTAQHLNAVPPLIRSNCKVYVIFKANNFKKIVEGVFNEVSGLLTLDNFIAMYEDATKEMNNHLTIINDKKMPEKYKYRKNWNDYYVFK